MKFEEKLIKLRKEKLLSQEELGEKLDVTRQTISKWELGQSKPDMDKMKDMSNLFGVSLEELTNDLNKKSGLLGISGFSDCRDVEAARENGDENAALALDMYYDRIAKYIAEYYIKLDGKVDYILDAGITDIGVESTVIRVVDDIVHILRPRKITKEDIEKIKYQTPWEILLPFSFLYSFS